MPAPASTVVQKARASLAAAFLLIFPMAGARAGATLPVEPRPVTFTAGTGLTFDNNLFRLPAGEHPTGLESTSRSDLFWNAFVGGQAYLPVGRQVVRADLNVSTTHYDRYTFLNYRALNGLGAWDWRIGSVFSGTLSYGQLQALSSFVDVHSFERNINTVRTAVSENEFWMLPDWHLTAGIVSTHADNSSPSLFFAKLEESALDAGIKYLTYGQNYLRLSWREAWGRYPNQEFIPGTPGVPGTGSTIDNRYEQTDVGLDYYQAPTGASQLTARLAYTDRRMPNLPQRNFSGPTGRISWDYAATGKVGFNLLARREIGAYTDLVTNYILTEAASITPYWLATSKVRLEASLERQRRDYRGDPQFILTNQPPEVDYLTFWRLTATYDATLRWRVMVGWQYSTRTSNVNGLDFSDQTVYATVQYKWD
jgi:exopolysaccharide biosynthesis operon protein EpsL